MRWTLKPPPDSQKQAQLAQELGIDPFLAGLLVQRGVDAFAKARSFFRPNLEELHDPYLMKDMDLAVKRVQKAIGNNENILVYGDYDVDGTTSVALMSSFLESFYDRVTTYIPDRYDEGYGVSYKGIDFAADNDFSLIIALDCGVKAVDKVAYAKEKGIDFIICDHHRPGKVLPDAVAVLDPKRADCSYPFDELCGCGVGFKLCQAITEANEWDFDILIPYLDLVATAIGADIVPIIGENRILAYHGLNIINMSPRAGFEAIIANLNKSKLTITDVVFIIAPRINAAGRMKHGLHAVELLKETDLEKAKEFAAGIENYNSDRRELDRSITEEALQQIISKKEQDNFTSVVYDAGWHKGVIGIVASRLTESYYRPTLVFCKSGDKLAASARSVKGFDVYNALEQCTDFIEQFGGHKYAAGLTLLPENYEKFKARFEEVVCATIENKHLTPEIHIDCQLPLESITPKFYRIIQQMAPFGPGNMTPLFMTENVVDTGFGKCVGKNEDHLKIKVAGSKNSKLSFNAIGFNLGSKSNLINDSKRFHIAYSVDENEWQGTTSLQLRLRDITS
ncbi:single-stranded-DNA-specific exonuclease RecJ [Nonlabens dokdonensis]|uniref:Single-stranded-DNA-specific exonuclease RecJ n=1 Tax=Nonlabens dokdonensis TaxID=328515 RepID=A0A1Z8BB72_9FLAO|nr:single-stranded-DNA-specific exonuclease RecJ [Nonlabens dokdonensis]OUS19809.1 single-stranded-DNA-specific exonuclease RecJ [Nonlabens dokdonensis]